MSDSVYQCGDEIHGCPAVKELFSLWMPLCALQNVRDISGSCPVSSILKYVLYQHNQRGHLDEVIILLHTWRGEHWWHSAAACADSWTLCNKLSASAEVIEPICLTSFIATALQGYCTFFTPVSSKFQTSPS